MTTYNGTTSCPACSAPLTPVQAAYTRDGLCRPCRRAQDARIVKNRMVK